MDDELSDLLAKVDVSKLDGIGEKSRTVVQSLLNTGTPTEQDVETMKRYGYTWDGSGWVKP